MTRQITLYTAKICPWAHRTELALKETGLSYQRFEVDLQSKPEWYAPKVNPASKVPALTYGGPPTAPEDPHPASFKLAESYVILEFIADISGRLLPSDPIQRARARFFVETFTSKFAGTFYGVLARGEPPAQLLPAYEALQELLPADGGFAIGEYGLADAAVTPFLARAALALKNDFGAYDQGLGREVYETLRSDPKYARYRQYLADVSARDNYKETFDEAYLVEAYGRRYSSLRAERLSSKV